MRIPIQKVSAYLAIHWPNGVIGWDPGLETLFIQLDSTGNRNDYWLGQAQRDVLCTKQLCHLIDFIVSRELSEQLTYDEYIHPAWAKGLDRAVQAHFKQIESESALEMHIGENQALYEYKGIRSDYLEHARYVFD